MFSPSSLFAFLSGRLALANMIDPLYLFDKNSHVGSLTPFYRALLSCVALNCEQRPWREPVSAVSERITQVRTDIYVTSFGPVSDTEMVSVLATPLRGTITALTAPAQGCTAEPSLGCLRFVLGIHHRRVFDKGSWKRRKASI